MRSALATLVSLLLTVAAHAAIIEVEGPQDSLDGPPLINHCTLRKAIINANTDSAAYPQCPAGNGLDTIVFLSPMTISLTKAGINEDDALTGDLDITDSLIITGNDGGTTIDGTALDRIFHINPHNAAGITVTLNNLNLRNGNGLGGGGAILSNNAALILNGVTISGSNADQGDGGAVWTTNGGTLTMTNSTISGNHASFHAGAMVLEGTTTITNSTIAGNASDTGLCGGLRNLGLCTLRSTIVAANTNTSPTDFIPNLDGTYVSAGYNVIGDLGAQPDNPTIAPTTGDQFGVTNAQLNIGPLQDNGGPTPTRALLAGSVAIDHGHSSGSTTDQRGLTRPCDLASVANATGGDGSDAGAFEFQGACAATNHDPVANDDAASVAEDSGANPIDVLSNDSDSDGDTLTITAVTQGAHGSVVNNGTNVTYAPAPNFNGGDSFTYTIDDGHGGAPATATVSVTVTPVNDPPVATPDSYTMNQDTTLTVAAPGALANDNDIDGDPLNAVLVTSPAHGTLTPLAADGSISYTPNPGFVGTDSFTYKANDGHADSNVVTVTIHVLDTQPPTITASVGTSLLWPPNHSLVNVGFALSVSDNGGGAVITSVEVRSDEDDVTSGGGEQSPDAKDIAPGTLRLRAERDGSSDGRVYVIRVTSTDASSNTAHRCVTVVVPKSQSGADIASVNAQASAAQAACTAAFVVGDGPVVGPKQ
jgi:hypothetical protein